jgi:Putative lumazine-binding
MDAQHEAVSKALSIYFDGLYYSDTSRLSSIFHPKAHYVCVSDGTLQYLTMDEYFPVVDARISPSENGEKRRDRILSITFAGPSTAFAHVECAIGNRFFDDFLTLIQLEDKWQIISKVFHYQLTDTL